LMLAEYPFPCRGSRLIRGCVVQALSRRATTRCLPDSSEAKPDCKKADTGTTGSSHLSSPAGLSLSGMTSGPFVICLVMLQDRLIGHDLKQLHHAAIFVRQYVAVLHVLAGEIDEAGPHSEVAGGRRKAIGTQYDGA
jgi:hypothetical protein